MDKLYQTWSPRLLANRTVPFAPVPPDLGSPTLRLTRAQYEAVVAHCLDCVPEEACGLLAHREQKLVAPAPERFARQRLQ